MDQNKIVIEVVGRTFIIPTNAVFSFNNVVLDVYAPNFQHKFNKTDIQKISLLDMDTKTPSDLRLLKRLSNQNIQVKYSQEKQDFKHSDDKKSKEPKKDVKLTSGMI